jgi:hypothetical protein
MGVYVRLSEEDVFVVCASFRVPEKLACDWTRCGKIRRGLPSNCSNEERRGDEDARAADCRGRGVKQLAIQRRNSRKDCQVHSGDKRRNGVTALLLQMCYSYSYS